LGVGAFASGKWKVECGEQHSRPAGLTYFTPPAGVYPESVAGATSPKIQKWTNECASLFQVADFGGGREGVKSRPAGSGYWELGHSPVESGKWKVGSSTLARQD